MGNISVIEPINLAFERVRQLLFRPFDLSKWFTIGFCAWLSVLGERGFSGRFNTGGNSSNPRVDVRQQWYHARDFVRDNLYWILPLSVAIIIFLLVLGGLFIWLNSRGKFMFLYCVALDRAEVREPWNRFAQSANSLFWFRLVLSLIGMVITLPVIVMMILAAGSMFLHDAWNPGGIMALVGLGMGLILIGICFALIRKLLMDFVVPIMYLRSKLCLDAWKEFWQLLRANIGEFVLYLLFQIVIGLAIGVMVVMVVLMTCCIAGCVLAIPYVGTVLFLPVLVFKRSYSLYYLAQYGPAYNVFAASIPPSYRQS